MAPGRPRSLRALAFGSSKRKSSPGPPSPTFSESTHASGMNFGADGPEKIITRANLKASLQAYEEVSILDQCSVTPVSYSPQANDHKCKLSCCAHDDV
jgi:hypothetical protein